MGTRCLAVIGWILLATGSSYAGTIDSIHIQTGTWDGSVFTPSGSDWNTYNPDNWAVGATAPGFGNPVLDGFNSVNLPDGEYYLYMATDDDTSPDIQITLGYSGGPSVAEVFTDSARQAANAGTYTLVSGSGFSANLVTGPQFTYTAVGSGQVYNSTGEANWIVDLNSVSVPEPASWTLFALGTGLFVVIRRIRMIA